MTAGWPEVTSLVESRLGYWSSAAYFIGCVVYAAAISIGLAASGLDEPIRDPLLAVMELLTLVAAPLLVVVMAAVHTHAPSAYKTHSLVALAFVTVMAALTISVHFVNLTVLLPLGEPRMVWPSVPYALELLAWDVFLGLALLFAAPAFRVGRLERAVRAGLLTTGTLCITS